MGNQPLPHAPEAEIAILACVLQEPEKSADTVSRLERESFYIPLHRTLWDACDALKQSNQAFDLVTLGERLDADGKLDEIGGMSFLREIRNSVPTIANLATYVTTIANFHNARKTINQATDLIGKLYESGAEDVPTILGEAENNLQKIGGSVVEPGFVHVSEVMPGSMEIMEGIAKRDPKYLGIQTGINAIDSIIMGFRPEELIVIAARPSIGKTALALNILKRMSLFKSISVPVGIFSFEMGQDMIGVRLLVEDAQIDLKALHQGRVTAAQWEGDLMDSAVRIGNSPIYIYDGPRSMAAVRRHSRKLVNEHGAKAIFIDYIQLIQGDGGKKGDNREQEVAKISSDLKDLAKELHIPVIVLAQLGRAAEGQAAKISHIRESGAIEQDADVVLLLQRERESDDEETAKQAATGNGIEARVIIGKNRNGPTGTAELLYFPQWTMFSDPHRVLDGDCPV